MKTYSILALAIMALWIGSADAKYSGGTGEPNDPYQIATPEDLNDIGNHQEDWNKQFILVNDVNLAQYTGTQFKIIGNITKSFTGVFDGNDHILLNAVINLPSSDYVGLFGRLGSGGQIRNLGVENIAVTGRNKVGGLCGENAGTILDCYSTGAITGDNSGCLGGLCGGNSGTISDCYATGTVTGGDISRYLGGLCGNNYKGTISACYATGAVTGGDNSEYLGGLCGKNSYGTISACYATGAVTGGSGLGGLCGKNEEGTISACFWDIQTSDCNTSAGGIGLTTGQMKTLSIFQNAGWGGKGWVMVDGVDYPRLAWENTGAPAIPEPGPIPLAGSGTEADPYQIHTAEEFASLSWYVGILDKHIRLMADLDVDGLDLYPIGDPVNPFTGVFDGNDHKIWNFTWNSIDKDGIGLFKYVGVGGLIRNLAMENVDVEAQNGEDIAGLVVYNLGTINKCYLTGSVLGYEGVGALASFNEGTITNCYSTANTEGGSYSVGGLVGTNKGTIIHCYCTASVQGFDGAGGLVGDNSEGTVTDCYSTGSASGMGSVGGLVGYNLNGTITDCFSSAGVSGFERNFGGLVGHNEGTIINCYSTGKVEEVGMAAGGLVGVNFGTISSCHSSAVVSGNYYAGGLVGVNPEGTITNCYSTGRVSGGYGVGGLVGFNNIGTVANSFWDIDTSGRLTSAGGTPKTTTEMKTRSTFIDAGWDFVNIWDICEGTSYPRLRWQIPGGDFLCPYGVDFADFAILASAWRSNPNDPRWNPACDISKPKDNLIDEFDLAIFCENWLDGTTP